MHCACPTISGSKRENTNTGEARERERENAIKDTRQRRDSV
jgi:hypothetical protein